MVLDSDYWKIGGDIGNPSVIEYIQNNVVPGEKIIATVLGVGEKTSIGALFSQKAGAALGGEYLLVTDRKVVVIKAGVGTWATGAFGLKAKTYLYDHIASIDVSRGLLFGEIEIVSSGMVEKGSGGFLSAASKDSVVQFEKKYFGEVEKLASTIRSMIKQRCKVKELPTADIPEQIKKLAELKEAGILTKEEFAKKKKDLLEKM